MWKYKGEVVDQLPEDCVGFVYIITNLTNQKKYIGKKLAKFAKIRYKMHTQKNGKKVKKKIRSKVDSDWQQYYGSSDALTKDIEELGTDKFTREILFYCYNKSQLSYVEAREQFTHKVLESDEYYNGHIRVRVHGKGILNSH
jgi:hypothetical protein